MHVDCIIWTNFVQIVGFGNSKFDPKKNYRTFENIKKRRKFSST